MYLYGIGQAIRKARLARNLTQARLASAAHISRATLSLLESGLIRDLGIRKVAAVLEKLGLSLTVEPVGRRPNYLRMACTSASVSFKNALTEDQFVRALVTGKIPAGRAPHLRALFDEVPGNVLQGLMEDAREWVQPGKLQRNVERLVHDAGATRKIEAWLKSD